MADRKIHYEAAFEDYLRSKGWPYVMVDEAKKAIFADVSLKSFDFVVYSESGPNLLVDVKGRKFPDLRATGKRRGGRAWENWITREDVDGLRQWQGIFDGGFVAALVFTYWLQGRPQDAPFESVHVFRGRHYAFMAITLADYVAMSKPRSARWQTITVAARAFADKAVDLSALL